MRGREDLDTWRLLERERQAGRGNRMSKGTEAGRRGGTWRKERPVKCGPTTGDPVNRAWDRVFIYVSVGKPLKVSGEISISEQGFK